MISLVLVLIIMLESYLQEGLLFNTYSWTIGFLPMILQLIVLTVAVILVAGAATVFFGGWIGIPLLVVIALMPMFNQEWFRVGIMAMIPVIVVLAILWARRRLR